MSVVRLNLERQLQGGTLAIQSVLDLFCEFLATNLGGVGA